MLWRPGRRHRRRARPAPRRGDRIGDTAFFDVEDGGPVWVVTGSNGENMIRARRAPRRDVGHRPGRGGRDVAGSAMAGGVGQGTAVQDQGNPFGITACSTGSGCTSDSSEPSGDADLSPGHHGHERPLRPRIGHLGHRLTCGATPGRNPGPLSLFLTTRPWRSLRSEWMPGRAGGLSGPYPVHGGQSASPHAARAGEGSDATCESPSSAAVVPSCGRSSKASLEPAVAAGLWGRPSRPGCTSRIRHDQIKSHPWTHTARRRASTVLTKAAARA